MANMSAAEMLKAEMQGLTPLKVSKSAPTNGSVAESAQGAVNGDIDGQPMDEDRAEALSHGVKRKLEDVKTEEADEGIGSEEDDAPADADQEPDYTLVVNGDGSVAQKDNVK